MVRITLDIEGMDCGMCEAHINDALRKAFAVKKVTSSRAKGKTEILSEQPLDEEKLRATIAEMGYRLIAVHTQPYEKKGFALFRR